MKAIVMGATSGIGLEVARQLYKEGWQLGLAGRRMENLEQVRAELGEDVCVEAIDITDVEAPQKLQNLIYRLGGLDLYFHSSGVGAQNKNLDSKIEISTVQTNCLGWVNMSTFVFNYFAKKQQKGHIAVITSVAQTRGIGLAPSYSSTKKFQSTYMQALSQLSKSRGLGIAFTEIRPGFVETALLNMEHNYPLMMQPEYVATKIVKALAKKKRCVTIDWRYRCVVFFWKLLPDWLWERVRIG